MDQEGGSLDQMLAESLQPSEGHAFVIPVPVDSLSKSSTVSWREEEDLP